MRAKRKGYKFGVQWIADNDEPTVKNPTVMADLISVQLLADLFGKEQEDVAMDVVRYRIKHGGA